MASTYSPNLALELIGTGDQAGTWGNTTNTNLGTLIEQAISGYVTQAVSTGNDTTITIPNGSTGVARNMYIELTGTGGTNTNLIVPANKKLYFIYNNTSSGQVTVKVSGQTGVSVANGEKVILVSNGTDIVTAAGSSLTGETTASLTAYGVNAGDSVTSGTNNVMVGHNAGTAVTTGSSNVTIGSSAGIGISTGSFNILIGDNTGAALTSNLSCTMVGHDAGSQYARSNNNYFGVFSGRNMDSTYNCGFGYLAVRGVGGGVATGGSNCGFGNETLAGLSGGSNNTAVGNLAGDDVSSGNWNTCIGGSCGSNVTTGSGNSFVGYLAGNGVTTGGTNSALGDSAYNSGNYSTSTCLGYNAQVDGSNQVQLGGSGTTTYAYGAVQDRSDARDKTDIRDTQLGLSFILALRPRDFKWDMREDYRTKPPERPSPDNYPDDQAYQKAVNQWRQDYAIWEEANKLANITHNGTHTRTRYHQGLIAQEVKQTMDAMGVDFGGYQDHTIKGGDAVLSIGYGELVAPLIKAIQELKAEFDEYKRTHP